MNGRASPHACGYTLAPGRTRLLTPHFENCVDEQAAPQHARFITKSNAGTNVDVCDPDFGIPGECEVGVPRAFGIAAVLGFRIHAVPINCLQRGQPDLRLGLAPARADSITSAQPIPMPGQGRALALAGMISIARFMKDRREDRAKDREFWRQFAATAARPASLQNAFERGERRASAPAAQAPASSIRGARDIRAHDDDHPRGRGNARGRARAYGHGDAASRGDVARVGPR